MLKALVSLHQNSESTRSTHLGECMVEPLSKGHFRTSQKLATVERLSSTQKFVFAHTEGSSGTSEQGTL